LPRAPCLGSVQGMSGKRPRIESDHSDAYMSVAPLSEDDGLGQLGWIDAQRVRRVIDRAELSAGAQLVPL
jgi:hypothetical protein